MVYSTAERDGFELDIDLVEKLIWYNFYSLHRVCFGADGVAENLFLTDSITSNKLKREELVMLIFETFEV